MKEKTTISLFNYYIGFWIIELKLNEKYKFVVRKDNRIDCYAQVTVKDKYEYLIRYNAKKYNYKWQIIHVVLHELGHIYQDYRSLKPVEDEFDAEYFALSKAKLYYPKYYNQMVNWTRKAIYKKDVDEIHKQGYIMALEKLGEL